MEKTWLELKPELFEALVDAFDEAKFARMLEFGCQKKLDNLAAGKVPYPDKVHVAIMYAERNHWLACLVEAARQTNQSHDDLQAVTADILAGIEAEGAHFYQGHIIDEEAGIEDERVLLHQLRPYLETVQRRTRAVPLTGLDESGEKGGRNVSLSISMPGSAR
jgi:hypothetical protein